MKFLNFEEASKQDWLERVKKELKGKDYDTVVWQTPEGFELDPLYTKDESTQVAAAFPLERGKGNYLNSWTILQEHRSAKNLNQNILTSLEGGAQGLVIQAQKTVKEYETVLAKVNLDWIKIYIHSNHLSKDLKIFNSYLSQNNIEATKLNGGFYFDPLTARLREGKKMDETSWKDFFSAEDVENNSKNNFSSVLVDGAFYGNHGASMINELAYTLALYHEYLLLLSEGGEKDVLSQIKVSLSVGRSYLMEIAKIKVFRLLHKQLIHSYDLKFQEVNLVAKSSKLEHAPIDQYNNLLRLTSQAMAAGIGGADDILLDTYDGEENVFSQRMSTNIQLMLIEESFLSQGHDISRGSYLIEKMIDELAEGAWKKFQAIEEEGGWIKAVASGSLQRDINEDLKNKVAGLNDQSRPWLGVNLFKNKKEKDWQSCEVTTQMEKELAGVNNLEHKF